MNSFGPWGIDDFDSLLWHDVHVHGMRFAAFSEVHGSAELVLDVDYILKWEQAGNGFQFTVCPAELVFHGAFGLKFELDYATPSAGMCPFSIDGIERTPFKLPSGASTYRWRIPINWPSGSLEFDAETFTLTLVGTPTVQSAQSLPPEKRKHAS